MMVEVWRKEAKPAAQGKHIFSYKYLTGPAIGFRCLRVSVTNIQLCLHGVKAAAANSYVPIKFY